MEAQAQAQGLGRKNEKVALEQGPQGQGGRRRRTQKKRRQSRKGVSVLGCLMQLVGLPQTFTAHTRAI